MTELQTVHAPLSGTVLVIECEQSSAVGSGESVLVLESMKVHVPVLSPVDGIVHALSVAAGETVERGEALFTINGAASSEVSEDKPARVAEAVGTKINGLLSAFKQRRLQSLDSARQDAVDRRHAKGFRSARENLADLVDEDSFVEYGQLAVAAQRQRRDLSELQTQTAADGIITGVASVNSSLFENGDCSTAIVVNDYSVLAGTQGFFHHQKLDRILAIAHKRCLPVLMYTEGGGGRPGDTDVTTMSTGLNCSSFERWAGLAGVVPRIAVANGYNFAGNAALYGAADITIACTSSWIGMAGPAMIEGGGLGKFKPTEIGPIEVQSANGVVSNSSHKCNF